MVNRMAKIAARTVLQGPNAMHDEIMSRRRKAASSNMSQTLV